MSANRRGQNPSHARCARAHRERREVLSYSRRISETDGIGRDCMPYIEIILFNVRQQKINESLCDLCGLERVKRVGEKKRAGLKISSLPL